MGLINYGNQEITYNYKHAGRSQDFNKLNYQLFPVGLYNGGLLTYFDLNTVRLAIFSAFIEDIVNEVAVRISTTTTVDIDVTVSTPYIVIRYEWLNSINNYADILAVDYASILADDIIIGKCIYNSSNILQTTFDYTRRTNSSLQILDNKKNNLKILSQEPSDNTVYVNSGILIIGGTPTIFIGGTSPIISATTLGRIDLVYINNTGTLLILEGSDSASPVAPDFPSSSIVLGIITRGASKTSIQGDQIFNYDIDRESSIISGGTNLSLYNQVTNQDRNIEFASDASLLWDESEDSFVTQKRVMYSSKRIKSANYLHGNNIAFSTIFTKLTPFIPNTNDEMQLPGTVITNTGLVHIVSRVKRLDVSTIILYTANVTTGIASTITITSTTTLLDVVSISW